jgi:hypothetical protein
VDNRFSGPAQRRTSPANPLDPIGSAQQPAQADNCATALAQRTIEQEARECSTMEHHVADTAFQVQYRKEAVMGFEQGVSYLRHSVLTEAEYKGNQATFLVADSGGATPNTRGVNGLIPARADDLNQYTAPWSNGTTWCGGPRSTSSRRRATAAASCSRPPAR